MDAHGRLVSVGNRGGDSKVDDGPKTLGCCSRLRGIRKQEITEKMGSKAEMRAGCFDCGRNEAERISAVLGGTHERNVRETGENHSICEWEMRMNTVAGFMGFCLDTGEEDEAWF